jgi:hypothetical protein
MTDTQQQEIPWILTKTGVLVMLFVVLGPLGLPFLYKSSAFSKNAKTFWAIAVLLYTVIAIVVLVLMAIYIWHLFQQIFNSRY